MATYLITGSSRGLGLELATQLANLPSTQVARIFATARSAPSTNLTRLIENSSGRVVYVKLDTSDHTSVTTAAAEVSRNLEDLGVGLDVLINNAGIMPLSSEGIETMDNLAETLHANVTAVQYVTSAFLPLLRKGSQKKVFNISSTLGSLAAASNYMIMPVPAYKISKAALNMLTVQYALSLEKEGFTFITLSPGWLRTDMGNMFGVEADLSVQVGAGAVLEAVHGHGKEDNGKFLNIRVSGWEEKEGLNRYDGLDLPW